MIARTEIKWDNASVPFPIRSTNSCQQDSQCPGRNKENNWQLSHRRLT